MSQQEHGQDRNARTGEPERLQSNDATEGQRRATAEKVEEFQQMKGSGDDATVNNQIPDATDQSDKAEQRRDHLEQKYQEENKQWQEQSVDITKEHFERKADQESTNFRPASDRLPHPHEPK